MVEILFSDGYELTKKYLKSSFAEMDDGSKGIGLEVRLKQDYEPFAREFLQKIKTFTSDCFTFADFKIISDEKHFTKPYILKIEFKKELGIFSNGKKFPLDLDSFDMGKYVLIARLRTSKIFKENVYSGDCYDQVEIEI
jgi:hypothetical protein